MPDFFAEDIDNSFNQSETNNTVGIDLDTVGNVDNSVNDSDNTDVALDNVGNDLHAMKGTCAALKSGVTRNENSMTRERADDEITRGCN